MKLQDYVVSEAIIPDLKSSQRDEVIAELIDRLIESGTIPDDIRQELLDMIIERENQGSTGFGKGVAVPHVKHGRIDRMVASIGVSQQGVDFNALDKAPVYGVFLLLSPKDRPDEHLQAMENIFSNLQKDTFRRFLRQATSRHEVEELLEEADTQQI